MRWHGLLLRVFAGLQVPAALMIVSGLSLGPGALAHATEDSSDDNATRRLERIRSFLEDGNPNQRAASLRQLQEEIRIEDVDEFRAYLGRNLKPRTLHHFRRRYEQLIDERLNDAEARVIDFVAARRRMHERRMELEATGADGDTPRANFENELAELRENRESARADSHREFRKLLHHGVALAPVLLRRVRSGEHLSYHVQRFRARLLDELLAGTRRQYARAPRAGSVSPFEHRCLVPLIDRLVDGDSEGWSHFREETAREALARFATYERGEREEARSVFLELDDWGIERLDRWAREDNDDVPEDLRRMFAEWNRLAVPIGFQHRTGIPVASYRSLDVAGRQRMLYRLEWAGGAEAVPVVARILAIEEDRYLQVEAAAVLGRLGDRRGPEFLERLALEEAAKLASISRRVLLMGALSRRENGDLGGAIEELERLLARFPGDYDIHFELAITALQAGRRHLAVHHFGEAIRQEPESNLAHYNLACAHALLGDTRKALEELAVAIDNGFDDADHAATDTDLESLRALPEFQRLLDQLRRKPGH